MRPPQKPGHIRWGDPAWIELLFSMRAGLFPWIPALYLVVPGLCWLMLRRPRARALALALSLMFLGQLYVNAAVFDFHCSWAFGPRRLTGLPGPRTRTAPLPRGTPRTRAPASATSWAMSMLSLMHISPL